MIDVESYERALEIAAYVRPSPGRRASPCTSGSTSGRSCPGPRRTPTRRERGCVGTDGRGRAARPRSAGARGARAARRGLRRRRGRAAGGAARGAPRLARAPAARPARVADHGGVAAARRRAPQRGRAGASRGGDHGRRAAAGAPFGERGRRHAAGAVLLLPPGSRARVAGGAHAARGRRSDDGGDRRRPSTSRRRRWRSGSAAPSGRCVGGRLDQPRGPRVVLRVLYLVYTAGHAGRVDLAGEAIRLARQLTLASGGARGARAARADAAQPRAAAGAARRERGGS